jgi:ankyrin repeat protein
MGEDEVNEGLLRSCREVNVADAKMYLSKENGNPSFEKDNWSPLLWAACNGSIELV